MLKKRVLILLLVILLVFANSAAATTAYPNQAAKTGVTKAVGYLKTVQNSDGGFPRSANEKSSPAITAWAIMALAAAGEDVTSQSWVKGENNAVSYLRTNADATETIDIARVVLALSAAGQKPVVGGVDLAAELRSRQDAEGRFGTADEKGMINTHAWAVLALKATGEVPGGERARQWLLGQQRADGGFGWATGVDSDPDDTAAAIQALRALGEQAGSSAIKKALEYLALCQQPDGGFSWLNLAASNAATDGWVLQALVAAGANPLDAAWTSDGKTAVDHLLGLQESSGKFLWQAGRESSPVQMTAFAILGLSGKAHPVSGPAKPAAEQPQPQPVPEDEGNGQNNTTETTPREGTPSEPAEVAAPPGDTSAPPVDGQENPAAGDNSSAEGDSVEQPGLTPGAADNTAAPGQDYQSDYSTGEETDVAGGGSENSQSIPYGAYLVGAVIAFAYWQLRKRRT